MASLPSILDPHQCTGAIRAFSQQAKKNFRPSDRKLGICYLGLQQRERYSLHNIFYRFAYGCVFFIKYVDFHKKTPIFPREFIRERAFQTLEKFAPLLEHNLFVSVRNDLVREAIYGDRRFILHTASECEKCLEVVDWLNNAEEDFEQTIERLHITLSQGKMIDAKEKITSLKVSLKSYGGPGHKKEWDKLQRAMLRYRQQLFVEKCSLKILFQPNGYVSPLLQEKKEAFASELHKLCEIVTKAAGMESQIGEENSST